MHVHFSKAFFFLLLAFLLLNNLVYAQNKSNDSIMRELDEIIISSNKFPEKKKNVAQRIDVVSSKYISRVNAQNTGDLLMSTGNVFVQKSQQGGSSPVIRGFEASRVLLVVDGIRMNNLIYRSGHLQNVITVDQNMLESLEVMHGPSSTQYGSDALGGAVYLRTKQPVLAEKGKKNIFKGNYFARYSSANNENTLHADFNIGNKKWAWLQSYTFSDFGDMRMGARYPDQYPTFGRRDSFVTRINGIDTILKNNDPNIQKFSGYKQWDILQKLLFKQNEKVSHLLNFQLSNTTNVPRYDRLQDTLTFPGSNHPTLRFADWYYGPQKRILGSYELKMERTGIFDAVNMNLNYQHIEESRYTRQFRRYDQLDSRVEKVNVAGVIVDARKIIDQHEVTVGMDAQLNDLQSRATRSNINTGAVRKLDTRYPDGINRMNNYGLFAQHIYKFNNKKLVLNDGFRFQFTSLRSTLIDTAVLLSLPFTDIQQENFAITGNAGIIYLPGNRSKLSLNFSSGFRVPNVDDLAKIFESNTRARQLVVPNPDIRPERTYNIDLGMLQQLGKKARFEFSVFYTLFRDALVKAPFQLNGQDSVVYNGVKSQVLANVNANRAYLAGGSAALWIKFGTYWTFSSTISYTYGRFDTDPNVLSTVLEKQANGRVVTVKKKIDSKPLDHIPPVFGKTSFVYEKQQLFAELFAQYNGWKRLNDFNAEGEDNFQYATADGVPSWWTLNVRSSYSFRKFTVQFAIENILDRNYRLFASGFSAPGRNFILSLRFNH